MAEALVSGIVENVLTNLGSLVVQEIGSALGVKKDLKRLKTILSTIQAVLGDAEEQQLNNRELRLWLWRIKDASYDADDILDDFEIEALRQNLRIQHHGNTTKKVLRFAFSLCSVAFRFKMSRRIKEVRLKFDEIAEDRIKFHLTEKSAKNVVGVGVSDAERGQTHSFVDESQVFGREGDKHEIGKLLLDMEGQDDLSVVAIQGMGGLGKTTLAQLVYNDNRADTYFELKMWVCVSLQFDVKSITAKVLESASYNEQSKLEMSIIKSGQFGMGQSQFRNLEMDQLQSQLRGQLQGKKFLLVLDDVWNEDAEKWDNLKRLLTGGAKGNKVLVTTRSKKVASIMGAAAATTYHLKGLSDDDCWDLFKERAFARGQEEAHPNLVVIGKEIVKKCGGVPLAAKSLGSLMHFKTDEHEWKNVKDNEIWRLRQNENDIIPALRLSYNHLPFYLKQCFAYCFLFSNGEEIYKEYLIQMWISQGIIFHPSGDYQCLRNTGEEYVKELLLRSFFEFTDDDQDCLKMHDLINGLARDVVGMEYLHLERANSVPSPEEVRYVSCNDAAEFIPCDELGSLRAFSNLRTLKFAVESLVDDFFLNFRSLRVLCFVLRNGSCPSSIGKLKHLRFLWISSKHIQSLPNKSITKLKCLQHLYILCPKLRELLVDIKKMVNLKSIYLLPDAPLSHMPRGLRSLTSLRNLNVFVVGKGSGCKLNDLHGLTHLGGFLRIKNLQNVSSAIDSAEANLRQKQIRWLILEWYNEDSDGHVINGEETHAAVLETLEPHPNIEKLRIHGYRGVSFPRWLMEPLMFPKMVTIILNNCDKCQRLPPFWKLPSLQVLLLKGMDALLSMENSVERGGQQVWFPSLTKLRLAGVPNLESFTPGVANNSSEEEEFVLSFPSLEELRLYNCSEKLVWSLLIIGKDNPSSSPPNSSLAKLKYLKINHCDDLESLPKGALQSSTSLEELELLSCPNLVINSDSLSAVGGGMEFLTSLNFVKFRRLPKLVSLPEGIQNAAAKLQILSIEDCKGLMGLPDWMVNLTLLQELELSECDHLTFRCQKDTGEDWPKISHIPTIKVDDVIIQNK